MAKALAQTQSGSGKPGPPARRPLPLLPEGSTSDSPRFTERGGPGLILCLHPTLGPPSPGGLAEPVWAPPTPERGHFLGQPGLPSVPSIPESRGAGALVPELAAETDGFIGAGGGGCGALPRGPAASSMPASGSVLAPCFRGEAGTLPRLDWGPRRGAVPGAGVGRPCPRGRGCPVPVRSGGPGAPPPFRVHGLSRAARPTGPEVVIDRRDPAPRKFADSALPGGVFIYLF